MRYPESAGIHNIEGCVTVAFTVNKDGSIGNCKVKEGIGWGCDEEAIRVIKHMPPWKPGMKGDKPVAVRFSLDVVFKLQPVKDSNRTTHDVRIDHANPPYNLNRYLRDKGRFPDDALTVGLEGNVSVAFTILPDGSVDKETIRSFNGVSNECMLEAMRLIQHMPAWTPSKRNGVPVSEETAVMLHFASNKGHPTIERNNAEEFEPVIIGYNLFDYLNKNCTYATQLPLRRINQLMIVEFDVDEQGNVSLPNLVWGIDDTTNKAVMAALAAMPPLTPAKNYGKAIKIHNIVAMEFDKVNDTMRMQECCKEVTLSEYHQPRITEDGFKYLDKGIDYPEAARKQRRQGNVKVGFIVDVDGSVSHCIILNSGGPDLDEEALKKIKGMPQYLPATLGGRPIPTMYMQEVRFWLH